MSSTTPPERRERESPELTPIPGTEYVRCERCERVMTASGQHHCTAEGRGDLSVLKRLNYLAGYPNEPAEETRKRFVPDDPTAPVVHSKHTSGRTMYHKARFMSYLEGKGAVAEDIAPAFFPEDSASVVVQKMGLEGDLSLTPACCFTATVGTPFSANPETNPRINTQSGEITATMRKMADQRFEPCSQCWNIKQIAEALDDEAYEALPELGVDGWDPRQALPIDHPAHEVVIPPEGTPHDFVNDSPEEIARRAVDLYDSGERDTLPHRQRDTMLALYHRHHLAARPITAVFAEIRGEDAKTSGAIEKGIQYLGLTPHPANYSRMRPGTKATWLRDTLTPEERNVIPFGEILNE